jgi:hypothetical protein
MHAPKTWDDFVDLIHQAVYEVDELKACMEEDEEEMEFYPTFLDPLDTQLRKLYDDAISNRYEYPRDQDLPYMEVVKKWGRQIPFRALLTAINEGHLDGVNPDSK